MGYTLDEIRNDITRATPASFEPVIDYVVTKVPRWAFEKFPGTAGVLGTQMQSVGEVMAIGRTFPESVQKAMRSLEQGRFGLNCDPGEAPWDALGDDELLARIAVPTPDRLFGVEAALRPGLDPAAVAGRPPASTPGSATSCCAWPRNAAAWRRRAVPAGLDRRGWRRAKQLGFSDAQLAWLWDVARGRRAGGPPGRRRDAPPTRPSTPARRSSPPRRRTTTRPGRTRTRCPRPPGPGC